MTETFGAEIEKCIRRNLTWNELPTQLRQVLHQNQRDFDKYVFNYSLKNQLRFRGNIVSTVFRNEQRYYELLIQKNVYNLGLFPYHLSDVVTRGLRVTPFNYYLDVLSQLLLNDKSYDTLPNFTAADCLRVLGVGRNEYLALVSEMKTRSMRALIFNAKLNPLDILPRFPANINIEPWWYVQIGYVLESDLRYITDAERALIDYLIDYGPIEAGKYNYLTIQSLYRKGFVYLDVPIGAEERISIPPLRNFVMNRVCGDYFENLLYKIFISVDEHMTVLELSQMLQVDLDIVKQAVSLFCRLGFAQIKDKSNKNNDETEYHASWQLVKKQASQQATILPITPLTFNKLQQQQQQQENTPVKASMSRSVSTEKDISSVSNTSSDGNHSDFSFPNIQSPSNNSTNSITTIEQSGEQELSSELEEISETQTLEQPNEKKCGGKRVGFIFDSTLAAFLMMGNLSPGLKNHAVTMFEVGKLCDESMDTFLSELEKVSLMDAEGEGDVSRYFTHAVILRSTICSLRHVLPGGLDLLRLECLEGLDKQTRDRVLEKKYKFLISCTPLSAKLSHLFNVPFFGQYFRSSDCSHMWTKMFYYQLTGYGPPSLYLARGSVLKALPRIFLGYGKLLINIQHSDAFVINSENYRCLNTQLKNGCVLMQAYGIRNTGDLHYEPFPFNYNNKAAAKWLKHNAVQRLAKSLDLEHHCGYLTFLNTGVPDMGTKIYNEPVQLVRNTRKNSIISNNSSTSSSGGPGKKVFKNKPLKINTEPCTPVDEEISNFTLIDRLELQMEKVIDENSQYDLQNVHQDHFAMSPQKNFAENIDLVEVEEKMKDEDEECSYIENCTLLDVHFGVPLFDIACNTYICEKISKNLCQTEHLSQLPIKAKYMNEKFHQFIKSCLHFVDEKDFSLNINLDENLPPPRINLAFENGHVFHWSGK